MKGIVMDIIDNKVIILTKDGEFLKVDKPNNQFDIGDEITVGSLNNSSYIYRKIASIAAAIIMIIAGSYGAYGYYNPYGYINVDINPSIEIAYNLYGRVLDVKALNDDGNLIISKLKSYKYESVNTILNNVLDNAIEENFIKENEDNVVLVTVTEKGRKLDEDDILESINEHIEQVKADAEVMVIEGDKQTYKSAKKDKISPGKLMLVNKALKANNSISVSDIIDKPVKEIVNLIKEAEKEFNKVMNKNNSKKNENDDINEGKNKEKERIREENKNGLDNKNDKALKDNKDRNNSKESKDNNNKNNSNENNNGQGKGNDKEIKKEPVKKENEKKNEENNKSENEPVKEKPKNNNTKENNEQSKDNGNNGDIKKPSNNEGNNTDKNNNNKNSNNKNTKNVNGKKR